MSKRRSGVDTTRRTDTEPAQRRMDELFLSRDITERKRVEQELHESEERYRSLVEAAPDVIYTVSAEDGSLTSLNPAFETLTGWSRAEWLGKPFAGMVHPDDLPVAIETFQKALRGETHPPHELRVLCKSGEYLVGEFTSTAHVKNGKVVGELGIARDITKRRRAEEALKKSASLLRDTGEMAKVGGWELDLSTKEVSWTEEVGRIHGVGPGYRPKLEEAINFYAPESRPALEEALKKASETGEPYDLESLFIPSGSKDKIWVRSLGRAVYSGGRIVKLAGTFQNIDKYKRAEEALRVSHRFLEIANRHTEMTHLLKEFVAEVRDFTGCVAVGLRMLDAEGRIPYQAYEGFDQRFYESESPLSIGSDQCMCINVIKGTTDPKLSFYTESGSFYVNGTTRFLATVSEEEKGRTRNVCNQFGYESVALVPIRSGDKILGLIHVADYRENMVPLRIVEVLEGAAMQLGAANQRMRAEETLRESEELYRLLAENVTDVIWTMDLDLRYTYISPSVMRLRGVTVEEAMAEKTEETLTPSSVNVVKRALAEELSMESNRQQDPFRSRTLEVEQICKDGSTVWTEVRATFLRNSEDRPVGILGVTRDISARRRAEEALSESEARFRSLFENATVGIYRTAPDGHILMANPALVRMLGFDSFEELAARNLECEGFESSYPRSVFRERIEREGQVIGLEAAWIRHDGSVIFVRESARAVRADDGRVLYYDGIVEDITTRRHAEEAVRRASAYNRSLIEASLDPLVTIAPDGKITDVNNATEKVTGLSRQQLIGTDFSDYFTDSGKAQAGYEQVFREGLVQDYELEIRHGDGHATPVLYNAAVYRDDAGNVIGVFAAARDITERKQAEEALRQSEQRFRRLSEATFEAIVIHDKGKILDANETFAKMFGHELSEVIGKNVLDFTAPESRDLVLKNILSLHGKPYEVVALRKDGSAFVEICAKSIPYGGRTAKVAAIRDITAHKRVEQELHESEERYRSLVEAAPDVIYTVSAEDGSLTSLNPAFETLTGWSRAQWLGKPFAGMVHPDDSPVAIERFQKALRGETHPPHELRVLCKSGEYLVGEFTSTAHVKEGKVVGQLGIARDITERRRAEEALKKSAQLLRDTGEMAEGGGWELDLSTKEVSWTEHVCRIHGVGPGYEPKLEEALNFYAPESRPALEEALKKAAETGEPWDLESLFIPSGSKDKIWVRSLGRAVYSGGRIAKLAGTFQNIDKYKRAEEALRQSKENFEALAESANEGILIATGEEGRHVYANRRAVEITGYPIEELLKTCMRDLAHPDELPKLAERYKERLERLEVPNHYETAILNKDGIKVPIEISPSRTIWQNQLASMVMFRDITERKRAEEALRSASAYNRSLIEASLDPLVTIAPDGKITDVNNTTEKVTGLSRQQLIGSDFSDYFTDSGKARAGYEQVFREGLVQDYELEIRHRDGHVTPVLYNASVYRDEAGDVIGVFAAARDITERKRAEEALRESEERFRSLVENATVGIYRTAPDGHILMANPALVRMLGFDSFEELAARNLECEGFESSYPRSVFRERIEREGQVIGLEVAWIRRDGSVVFVRESARAVRADDGRVLHYDGIVEDITTRRHAEEGMRQLSGRLLRSQDEERRRLARELHETTAQGLAGLAVNLHMVIDSAAHLSPRASACLSESLELAEQCSREIRTISYLLHPPLVDEAGLDPALRWYTAGFGQRSGIEVHVDVSPEFGRLPSEVELTLYRIVQEALTNIHRHSGSKTARICLERRPNEIVLTVADEGHGFPSAALGIAGPESADMGVGIPGMQERMRQLGGRLRIQSGRRGTTLTAILPRGQVTNGQITLPFGG